MSRELPTSVRGCARCGDDHDGLEYRPFRRPVADADGPLTHWAPCPATGDPILLRFVDVDRERVERHGRLAVGVQVFDADANDWSLMDGGDVALFLREPHVATSAARGYAYIDPEPAS